ncbi:MAG: DUF6883 domain-containing protein [Planctomycetota bacterium]
MSGGLVRSLGEQEICGLLEWYICGCIPYGPNNLGGWWSDGMIHLEIANPETDRFKLLGVTWIDSLGIAPFEIDLELARTSDDFTAKSSPFGVKYELSGEIGRPGHQPAAVLSGWIVEDDNTPRLVTAYPG